MRMRISLYTIISLLIYSSCNRPIEVSAELPICLDCGEPNHFLDQNGDLYVSYSKYLNDTIDELRYRKFANNSWSEEFVIAQGGDWFTNWADFPSICKTNEFFAAHWLQKSSEGTYDYDIKISTSKNGKNWNKPFILHNDGINAEHGFASLLPFGKSVFATWLDGRNTKSSEDANSIPELHDHNGAMTLRSAFFDVEGNVKEEIELDSRICDCCQTAAVKTNNSIVVAYRDRSINEIRDISRVVFDRNKKQWSAPSSIYVDNWQTSACPVNGPSLTSINSRVACGWYTQPDGNEKINVAISKDYGYNFEPAITIDSSGCIGRVDVEWIDQENLCIAYLKELDDFGLLVLKSLNAENQKITSLTEIPMDISRSTGFPKISIYNNRLFLSYVKTGDPKSIAHMNFPLLLN